MFELVLIYGVAVPVLGGVAGIFLYLIQAMIVNIADTSINATKNTIKSVAFLSLRWISQPANKKLNVLEPFKIMNSKTETHVVAAKRTPWVFKSDLSVPDFLMYQYTARESTRTEMRRAIIQRAFSPKP